MHSRGKKTNTHNELRKTLSTHGIEMQLSKVYNLLIFVSFCEDSEV